MELTKKDIYEYVVHGGDLRLFSAGQIKAIPQEIVNEYVVHGGDLRLFSEDQIEAIPQEIVNEYVAHGGDLGWFFSADQIKAIPQEIINERAANGGSLGWFSADQRKTIPEKVLHMTNEAREALILYTIGKIKKQDLPIDVFVNHSARRCLLEVIRVKTEKHFYEICEKNGYIQYIPQEVLSAFDERLQTIEKEVTEKTKQGIKELSEISKRKKENIIDEMREMGW